MYRQRNKNVKKVEDLGPDSQNFLRFSEVLPKSFLSQELGIPKKY